MILKLHVKISVFHEQIYLVRNQAKEVEKSHVLLKNVVASPCIGAKNPIPACFSDEPLKKKNINLLYINTLTLSYNAQRKQTRVFRDPIV